MGYTSTDESLSDDGINSNTLIRDFNGEANPIGVHNSGANVPIVFNQDLAQAGSQLTNQQNVELVAAKLTPEDGAGAPSSTSNARELLSDVDKANANASFEMLIDDSGAINSNGRLEHTESFSSGHYVIFAAVKEGGGSNGFETDASSNISVDGDVVIIGTDTLTVQKSGMTVSTPSEPEPGENLAFDVDANNAFGSSTSVTHAVAVYKKSTFEDARFDLVADSDKFGNDFSFTNDAQLEHSINELNGVADVEAGTTLNQNDLTDGEVRQPVTAGSAIDFFADEVGTDAPNTDPITAGGTDNSKYERIDASVTAVNGESAATTVNVDTFGNFSEGTYQYVVVSTLDDNESQLSTATGTVDLFSSTKTATLNSNNRATISFNRGKVASVGVTVPSSSAATQVTAKQSDTPTGSASAPSNSVETYVDISADAAVDGNTAIDVGVSQSTINNLSRSHRVKGSVCLGRVWKQPKQTAR